MVIVLELTASRVMANSDKNKFLFFDIKIKYIYNVMLNSKEISFSFECPAKQNGRHKKKLIVSQNRNIEIKIGTQGCIDSQNILK